ncbi:6-carboxytetrahydropterin synthase QueD [Limibacter armeniacum]|uniref:6-carboxytetrahydropterin synthase QueD n=1 Tax=Limibacter armeniacum TaxID=466084 RepID=UPI002FE615E1
MQIFKEYTFEAAHRLPYMPEGHPCGRIHGHSWKAVLFLDGELESQKGWVLDFNVLDECFKPTLALIDHNYLNEIEGLENPTCEVVAKWIWERIKPEIPQLSRIEVWETKDCGSSYAGS